MSSDDVPRESLLERFSAKAMGGLTVAVVVLGVKNFRLAKRPNGEDRDSFMSGHTATAFLGAELLRLDYGAEYPWVAAAGYSVAMTTAMFRIACAALDGRCCGGSWRGDCSSLGWALRWDVAGGLGRDAVVWESCDADVALLNFKGLCEAWGRGGIAGKIERVLENG